MGFCPDLAQFINREKTLTQAECGLKPNLLQTGCFLPGIPGSSSQDTCCAGTREWEPSSFYFHCLAPSSLPPLTFGIMQRKDRRRLEKERRSNGPPMKRQGFQMARRLQDGVTWGRSKLGNTGKEKEGINGSPINWIKKIERSKNPRMECEQERNTMEVASSSELFQVGSGSQIQTFLMFLLYRHPESGTRILAWWKNPRWALWIDCVHGAAITGW